MGGGSAPGPQNALSNPDSIDDGTLARVGSPAPGAVGVDAPARGVEGGGRGHRRQRRQLRRAPPGTPRPDGQCFALADRRCATPARGAPPTTAPVVPDGDYVWGTEVSLASLRRGDIVQFRDYTLHGDDRRETELGDGHATSASRSGVIIPPSSSRWARTAP